MSWSATFTVAEIGELRGKAPDSSTGIDPKNKDTSQQLAVAKQAAIQILLSGAVGASPHRVILSGHANPDHQPQQGWTNDTVNVTVFSLLNFDGKISPWANL